MTQNTNGSYFIFEGGDQEDLPMLGAGAVMFQTNLTEELESAKAGEAK